MRAEVVGQQCEVGGPAGRIPDRIEQHLRAGQPGIAVEADPELDDLGIDGRPGIADRLDVELPELAVAAGLRSVVAEHRTDLAELDGRRPRLHPVLDVGPDDAGRRLGAERQRFGLLRAWGEPEELLLDDVGDLAHAALEDRRRFEERRLDPAVAVAGRQVTGEALKARPGRGLRRQQVARAARRSIVGHQVRSTTAITVGDGPAVGSRTAAIQP